MALLMRNQAMLDIERVMGQERRLRGLTGMKLQACVRLMIPFNEAYQEAQGQASKPRQRAKGAGGKAILESLEAKLFLLLFDFKCYPTFAQAGILFEVERSQAQRWVHRLQPILETALDKKLALPERQLESVEQFLPRFADVPEVLVDSTERPMQRSQDAEDQKPNYSGKKKRHPRQHLGVVDRKKRVLVLTAAAEGKIDDKRWLDQTDLAGSIPTLIAIAVESGISRLAAAVRQHPDWRQKAKKAGVDR